MLNCGAPLEVFELFGNREEVKIYVIDSHRPFNLDSCLPESKNVLVFEDASEKSKLSEYMDAYEDIMVIKIYAYIKPGLTHFLLIKNIYI